MFDVAGFLKRLGTICPKLGFGLGFGRGFGRGFAKNTAGNAAIIFAISAIPMTLAVGGAVDYARYYDAGQSLQTAIDAAVLAGASAGNSPTVAAQTFSSWAVKIDGTVGTPTFCVGKATTACDSSATQYYSGSASGQLNLYFTRLAGIKTVTVHVAATAQKTVGSTASSNGSGCLWLTQSSLTMNSNATLNATSCQINVLSSSTTNSFNSGSYVYTPTLCAVSSNANKNGNYVVKASSSSSASTLVTSCPTPVADPYVGKYKAPSSSSCDHPYNISYDYNSNPSVTLNPGVYCGGVNFNGGTSSSKMQTVTLNPGLYILKNGAFNFNANTSVSGTGVTFFFVDSGSYLQFNSKSTSTLSAETSSSTNSTCTTYGTCGVLMYETSGLSTSYLSSFDSGTSHTWTGIVYLPSRIIQENSSANVTLNGDMVVNGMTINSSTVWTLGSGSSGSSGTGNASVVRLIK